MAERVAIFIDGWHFAKATYEGLGIRVDFKRLLSTLADERTLLRAVYYVGEWTDDGYALMQNLRRARLLEGGTHVPDPAENERRRTQQQGFIRMLNRNGYQVVRKPVRVFADGNTRAEIDVDLTVDMLTLADRCERQVLVSGDAAFVPVVRAVGMRGVRMQVVASQTPLAYNTTPEHPRAFPARASDDLLDAADEFTELKELVPQIALNESRRAPRPFVPHSAGGERTAAVPPGASVSSVTGSFSPRDAIAERGEATPEVGATTGRHEPGGSNSDEEDF